MEDKKRISFPKDFFTKKRPITTNKEALKDVIPIKWSEEVKKEKNINYSKEQRNLL